MKPGRWGGDIQETWIFEGKKWEIDYPLVMTNIAIENGHFYRVSFPIKNGDFP